MSEKRFVVENDNNEVSIKDKVEDNYPFALAYEHIDDADNLIQECLSLVGLLNEQQATIRKLQDLCGKSDGENAKLRIENKKLKAKLKEKEEDERLYANEILELRETNKEHIKFKSLGGDY